MAATRPAGAEEIILRDASQKDRSIKGIIVGDGPERGSILHTISAIDLKRIVKLHSYYRNRKDAHRILKGASLFLNMSEREGLSATTLESLALGTPVALPSYSPIPDMVKEMCIVADKDDLPDVVVKVARSRSKGSFIKNRRNLENFRASGIIPFYDRLFKSLSRCSH